ncbi:MAG: hypothetical protein P8X92_05535 [Dehalococcoidia bacterium]
MQEQDSRIGEVVVSSTGGFTAQCYELYSFPPLGSLVKCREAEHEIYAITSNASTSSLESGRHPIARGMAEESEEGVFKTNPQLSQLLKSEFEAVIAGYGLSGSIRYQLPPKPARIHSFVYRCSSEEINRFSGSFEFLSLICASYSQVPVEELISACIRQMAEASHEPQEFMLKAGKNLASLFGSDFQKLKTILTRLRV